MILFLLKDYEICFIISHQFIIILSHIRSRNVAFDLQRWYYEECPQSLQPKPNPDMKHCNMPLLQYLFETFSDILESNYDRWWKWQESMMRCKGIFIVKVKTLISLTGTRDILLECHWAFVQIDCKLTRDVETTPCYVERRCCGYRLWWHWLASWRTLMIVAKQIWILWHSLMDFSLWREMKWDSPIALHNAFLWGHSCARRWWCRDGLWWCVASLS